MSIPMYFTKRALKKPGTKITHETFNVEAIRENAKQSEQMKPVKGVRFEERVYGGVTVDVAIPEDRKTDNAILYIHGGCMVSGDPRYSRSFTSYLAKEYGGNVYGVAYALAPENKYPLQIEQCADAFSAIAKENPSSKITMLGESGGAYLILATTVMLRKRGQRQPDALVPYSPLIDWSDSLDRSGYPDDMLVDYLSIQDMRDNFCPEGQDYTDPDLSPLYADFTGFPPIRVVWDKSECLTPDCEKLIEKAKKAGVYVEHKIWKGTFHAFEIVVSFLPEAKKEVKDTIAFIRNMTK